MKRYIGLGAALAFATLLTIGVQVNCFAQDGSGGERQAPASDAEVETVHVRDGIYMLVGRGANVTVQIGDDGVLVVDSMVAEMGDELLAAVRKLSSKPIRYLLNTSARPDHTGGNAEIAKAGSTVAGGNVLGAIQDSKAGAAVLAHENVLNAMSMLEPPPAFEGWPTSTYFTAQKDLFFNGDEISLVHQPAAATNGDSFIIFRRASVIAAGDVFSMEGYPRIDEKNGGTFRGVLDSLNRLIDLTIPQALQEGGTKVIPAYGRICDESEVVEYRDMLTIIGDQIQEMIREGRSLREVLKAQPTLGYDPRFGSDSGEWTTTRFVETVYREFSAARKK